MAQAWETFHGDPGLSGAVTANFPREPAILWRTAVQGPVSIPCLIDEQSVYAFTDRGQAVAIKHTGEKRWSQDLADLAEGEDPADLRFGGTGILTSAGVAVASESGTIFMLRKADGTCLWRKKLEGIVRAGLGKGRAKREETVLVMAQSKGVLYSLRASDGHVVWTSAGVGRCDSPPAADDKHIIFGSCEAALHIVSAADGSETDTIELGRDAQVAAGAAIVGGNVYAGDRSGKAVAAEISTGKVLWHKQIDEGGIFTTPAVAQQSVVFGSDAGKMICLAKADGTKTWSRQLSMEPTSPVIAGSSVLTTDDGSFYSIGLADGGIVWEREFSDALSPVAVCGGLAVFGTDEGEVIGLGTK